MCETQAAESKAAAATRGVQASSLGVAAEAAARRLRAALSRVSELQQDARVREEQQAKARGEGVDREERAEQQQASKGPWAQAHTCMQGCAAPPYAHKPAHTKLLPHFHNCAGGAAFLLRCQ